MNKGLQPTHTGRLDPRIRRIWEDLGRIGPQYTLIGGTAIALYCNHRQSVDVDLSCRGAAEHPRTIRRSIRSELGKHKVLQRRTGIVIKFFATDTSPKIEVHGTDPWKIPVQPFPRHHRLTRRAQQTRVSHLRNPPAPRMTFTQHVRSASPPRLVEHQPDGPGSASGSERRAMGLNSRPTPRGRPHAPTYSPQASITGLRSSNRSVRR